MIAYFPHNIKTTESLSFTLEIIRSVITQVLLFIGTIFESLVTIIGIIFKYVAGLALIIILIIWILSDKEIQKYSETEIDQMLSESWNDGYGQGRTEGIKFICSTNVGIDISVKNLIQEYDAICLAGGSTVPRDLSIEGRDLDGIHFAMDFLSEQNRWDTKKSNVRNISAKNKNVVIIGGGDTGADCLGTSIRQGAKNIVQLEILPEPPIIRSSSNPWPEWPLILRTSSAHEESGEREFSVLTKSFDGITNVKNLTCQKVKWGKDPDSQKFEMKILNKSEFKIKADLVLLALGFVHPLQEGLLNELGVEYDERGNVKTNGEMMTSKTKIFACGDMERGQSLVVNAIASGRKCAKNIDVFLEGQSLLPDVKGYIRSPFSKI